MLSIAQIDQPEWVVAKEKFVRYKIFHIKHGKKIPEPGIGRFEQVRFVTEKPFKAKGSGRTLFVYDFGDALRFIVFTYARNYQNTGWERHNVKTWVIKHKNGKLNVWAKNAMGVRNVAAQIYELIDTLFPLKYKRKSAEKRLSLILDNFLGRHGLPIQKGNCLDKFAKALYPLLPKAPKHNLSSIYSSDLKRATTFKQLVRYCFGSCGKKLLKEVGAEFVKGNYWPLVLGKLVKGLMPVDYIHDVLYCATSLVDKKKDFLKIRELLKNYNPARIKHLLEERPYRGLIDGARLYHDHRARITLPRQPHNFQEIHDTISRQIGRSNSIIDVYDLPVREHLAKIQGAKIDQFRMEIPENNDQLIAYGKELNHCVGGYGRMVARGDVDILAIYEGEKLKYNISLSGKRIEQFRGKANSSPVPEDRETIVRFLVKEKIITSDYQPVPFRQEYAAQFVDDPILF
jgi:hypothetical protein